MYEPVAPCSSIDDLRALAPVLTDGSLLKAIALQLIAEREATARHEVIVHVERGLAG